MTWPSPSWNKLERNTVPRLDERLKTVARQIRSRVHVDVGADHGHLLRALLASGRIERAIAVENKRQPYENCAATLQGLQAEVRLGDGLAVVQKQEADSLSVCGMGGRSVRRIVEAFPERVPNWIVLQPNSHAELLREWALKSGFHLASESTVVAVRKRWRVEFPVLTFQRVTISDDPAYTNLDREAAVLFGPWNVRCPSHEFLARLAEQRAYLQRLSGLTPEMSRRLKAIERVVGVVESIDEA